jgi:exodeoxyribonuclease VII small subunit
MNSPPQYARKSIFESAPGFKGASGKSKMAENTQVDVKKLSFERALEELESIVKRLEDGKVPLEESVAIYERGESLKRRCEELLRQAEARVDKITTDANGQVTGTEPLDVQ